MPSQPRLQVRCDDETKNKYAEAANAFGLTYGEFALLVSEYVLENRDDFQRFVTKAERRRENRR